MIISDSQIEKDIEKIRELLKYPNSSDEISPSITKDKLIAAGEMFIYMTMCPKNTAHWITFFKDLLDNYPPSQIILTLNRLSKANFNGNYAYSYVKDIVKEVFIFITKKLNLKFPIVQVLTSNGYDQGWVH